jgi:hypothetical protein
MSAAQFTAYERSIGADGVRFSARAVNRSGTVATVGVQTLVTHDSRFGCQSWSGSYTLLAAGGRWRIARAALVAGPCPG